MYKIFADGTLIYDSTLDDYKIGKGQVTLEADKSGSFVFSLYPDHFYYDSFVQLKTVVTVYKGGRIVFRGRVLDDATDYWNNKVLTCEGELGFLQDSIIRPFSFSGTPAELFTQLIDAHNAQVDAFKQFKVGTVTVVDANDYIARSNEGYETTLANLNSRLLEDSTGGHLYVTHGDDGTDPIPTIHYLADFTKTATQVIEFGANLKNYTKKVSSADIATAIIPLGATVDDGNSETTDPALTIASVNDGVDYVYSEVGVALRGWVFKTAEWPDVTDASILKSKAEAYVAQVVNQNVTLELTAVDLHLLDRSIESYNVCEYIPVSSAPHGFHATLLCNKQTLDLLQPANDTVTLGAVYSTFTETSNKKVTASASKVATVAAATAKNTTAIINMDTRVKELEEGGGVPGERGATFTPSVSEDGTLSWTNDKELENPDPVNIRGPQGEKGDTGPQGPQGPAGADGTDGVSCTHSWNGTVLTVTSASGTSSADLKGDKGDTGPQGPQGESGAAAETLTAAEIRAICT